jgi:hypothetical protein
LPERFYWKKKTDPACEGMFMGSGSLSEDLEMDKESTAHVDDFKGALKTLLEKNFVSLEDALK